MTLAHVSQPAPMFGNITHIKECAKEAGSHWFDRDAMRFFNTRILRGVIQGAYFITSEAFSPKDPRRFTIRKASLNGRIDTVGKFQAYNTAAEARAMARTFPFEAYPK